MSHAVPLSAWLATAVFALVCTFAVWKGGWEERIAGGALALAALATPLLKDHSWLGPQWGVFAVDIAYLALLLVIALRTRRWWPIFAAAFQLLGILTHAASIVDDTLSPFAYISGGVIWSYAVLATVALGTFNAWRERRQLPTSDDPTPEAGATRR